MDVTFSTADYLESSNSQLIKQVEAVEKLCKTLNLECIQVKGRWGVGLKLNNYFFLINPLDLVSSIYESDCWLYAEGDEKTGNFKVICNKREFCYEWILYHNILNKCVQQFYSFAEYQSKIIYAINNLYQKLLSGAEIAYDNLEVGRESIELCIKQLAVKWVLPSNYRIFSSEISLDKFAFDSYNEVEIYSVRLNDRGFQSRIADWDNDFDHIRHSLENYVYTGEARIRLGFDAVDTIIKFKHLSVLKSIEKKESGYFYQYDERCMVEIKTDDLGKSPILKGYCEERPTIRAFYEGLLLLGLNYTRDPDGYIYEIRGIDAYNQIKSPIIEHWLKEEIRDYYKPRKRQTEVDKVWIINPDYYVCIEEITTKRIFFEVENDTFEGVHNGDGVDIVVRGFSAWVEEIAEIIIKSETGEEYTFDWKDYHRRGLELAKLLRSKLPSNIDLWYDAPFEDKSNTIPRPILIL